MTLEELKRYNKIRSTFEAKIKQSQSWKETFVSVDIQDLEFLMRQLSQENWLNEKIAKHIVDDLIQ